MLFEAATLAVAAAMHLSGNVHGRGRPFDADHAGIAEVIIGVLLAAGAVALLRVPARARTTGIVCNVIAAAGFANGLSMTARGGDLPDIAYHVIVLPLLIGSVVALARTPRTSVRPRRSR